MLVSGRVFFGYPPLCTASNLFKSSGIESLTSFLVKMSRQMLKKITLLRVIPTMTCWVEVVRWGLSLRIWWEEWRIWKTLISGFLGLVILVRWALVTMFLSWTTQTGCRIHRTYVSLIGSGEGRHTTHLLKCVLLLSTSQTDWKQSSDVLSDISFDILSDKSSDISSDILSDISSDILSDIFLTYLLTFFLTNLLTLFLTYLLTFFLTYLSTCFLTYFLTFFLTYQNQNLTSTASHKKPLCKLYIYLTPRSKSTIHNNFVPVNVIALSASDRPAKRQLSPKMQNACSSTHTHTPHASDRPAKQQLSPKMQKSLKCHNYISWRVQTMKSDARHCGSSAGSA